MDFISLASKLNIGDAFIFSVDIFCVIVLRAKRGLSAVSRIMAIGA